MLELGGSKANSSPTSLGATVVPMQRFKLPLRAGSFDIAVNIHESTQQQVLVLENNKTLGGLQFPKRRRACMVCEKSQAPGDKPKFKVCSGCKDTYYCSKACQKQDLKTKAFRPKKTIRS